MLVMLTVAVGVGAHQQEGPMSNLPDCCKKAGSNGPAASMARLCCNLNCSEPGSTGNSSSSSFSAQRGTVLNTPIASSGAQFNFTIILPRQPQHIYLADSHPKYIKHLTLLI